MRLPRAFLVTLLSWLCWHGSALASPDTALTAARERLNVDTRAGRPAVAQVHVPLCDNAIIRCGGGGRGDGDDLKRNLYWATSEGFVGWFERRRSGWKRVGSFDGEAVEEPDVREVRIWHHPQAGYVVAYAWRGRSIDRALEAYAADASGGPARIITLDDGTVLHAGGDAHVVAYVGHNRLMDLASFDWDQAARAGADRQGGPRATPAPPRGVVAIACHTAAYLERILPADDRAPLLLTRDFLMASAPTFEGAWRAFVEGGTFADIRQAAATGYATGQGKPLRRVRAAFTNPSDPRWGR